jgi:alpha-1,3-mannosyltransferase
MTYSFAWMVIFSHSDTYLDVLELIYMHLRTQNHITCGMDYWKSSFDLYDTWVSRSMTGNLILQGAGYANLFYWDPEDHQRIMQAMPVQVYSCWNGLSVINSEPLKKHRIKFRAAKADECQTSECQLLARDFWTHGYGKIVLIPYVGFV